MKKVLLIAMTVFFAKTSFSQDVIITKTGESIRTKIIEVTDETISYKKYNDQEGATFILKRDKIKVISWENGNVDDYEKENIKEEKVLPTQNVKEDVSLGEVSNNLPFIMNRKGRTFYMDNGQIYDEIQFKQFLMEKNLGGIWIKYSNGKKLMNTGLILIGGGVFLEIVGLVVTVNGAMNGSYGQYMAGSVFCALGGLAEIAGIPIAIVGGVRRNRSISDYNTIYGGKPRPQYSQNITLKAGSTGKGLGFTLNF